MVGKWGPLGEVQGGVTLERDSSAASELLLYHKNVVKVRAAIRKHHVEILIKTGGTFGKGGQEGADELLKEFTDKLAAKLGSHNPA